MEDELRFGIDVGGTFTDAVLIGADGVWSSKALTDYEDWRRGALEACRAVAANAGLTLEEALGRCTRFGLGTTAVTNVLATRSGRTVGLLTTAGFEATVPFHRGRTDVVDGLRVPVPEVISQRHILGVNERIDASGRVLVALDDDEVISQATRLVEAGVEAIGVSFLWAHRNARHEDRAAALVQRAFPSLPVATGAGLAPVIREYERTMLVLLNLYVAGAFDGVEGFATTLHDSGLRCELLLVHSGGGAISVAEAARTPLVLAMSGPAAGVAGAGVVAESLKCRDLLTCDIGGTSVDLAVIQGGQPGVRSRGSLMGFWTPLRRLDVESVGAGGGSVAWQDTRGMLRVGPRSAGSRPGPACYGRGGTEPTLTDAHVLLGFLDASRFLGGRMDIDANAAEKVCAQLGQRIGLQTMDLAWGIRALALSGMARSTRSLLATRNVDPRRLTLAGYGGSAGLLIVDLARSVGCAHVLVPGIAPVLSAFGAAAAEVRRWRERSVGVTLTSDRLEQAVDELRLQVAADLTAEGIPEPEQKLIVQLSMCFANQVNELEVEPRSGATAEEIREAFVAAYRGAYGAAAVMDTAEVRVQGIRVVGGGGHRRIDRYARHDEPRREAATQRRVQLARGTTPVSVRCVWSSDLSRGCDIDGPLLIDADDTTIWVPSGASARVDEYDNVLIDAGEA